MRLFAVLCWLTLPLLAWAYHSGPGQERMKLDEAQALLDAAGDAAAAENYEVAGQRYAEALAQLPGDQPELAYPIRLAMAEAQMLSSELPEARLALESLLEDLRNDPQANENLEQKTRAALANAQYHMTWLMRLEGLPAEAWEPEADAARQNYRLLAEEADSEEERSDRKRDLEAAIRLARMDLEALQALKLPSQCKGCCSSQCKKPSRKKSNKQSEKPGQGANMGPLPDGSGN